MARKPAKAAPLPEPMPEPADDLAPLRAALHPGIEIRGMADEGGRVFVRLARRAGGGEAAFDFPTTAEAAARVAADAERHFAPLAN